MSKENEIIKGTSYEEDIPFNIDFIDDEPVDLDLDVEAAFIAKKVSCSIDEANSYLDSEEIYMYAKGMSSIELDSTYAYRLQAALQIINSHPGEECGVIDYESLLAFIINDTGMDKTLVERMLDAENEYLEEIGAMLAFADIAYYFEG